jgi:uncharacterized protein (DUF1697 family)
METWIALLKGVNVGGKNKLPMKALAAELAAIGLSGVKTYIQSGNVVFRCPKTPSATLAARIASAINTKFGFEPEVSVLSGKDLAASAAANPFPDLALEADGKTLHFFFLAKAPAAFDQARIETLCRQTERWRVNGTVFYLHAPEGFHSSKLAAQVEKSLGVTATARNWNTVHALLDLAGISAIQVEG